jgi:glycine/D-amino acid oxidase-like deaminating enzyme
MLSDVLIVGGGVFGVEAALELRARGATVTILEPGPLPHPDASSTDISKLIRADYGSDVVYAELMEACLDEWRARNTRFGRPLFHETGLAVLSQERMDASTFEGASFATLSARGHFLERLDEKTVPERLPAWLPGRYVDGYINPRGGWAESGEVVRALATEARAAGIEIREGVRVRPLRESGLVDSVQTESGEHIAASTVVVAAGAFTPALVPELADRLAAVGQPVFHFDPPPGAPLTPPRFLPWAADIGTTGWYGFPVHTGVLKIANHGRGIPVDPAAERVVPASWEPRFRAFLAGALPSVAEARVVRTRLCLYCDSFDGDFFIDAHPERRGLVVAAGGSGHAFKFAPVLGKAIADAVEGVERERWRRFAWRERGVARAEAARATE